MLDRPARNKRHNEDLHIRINNLRRRGRKSSPNTRDCYSKALMVNIPEIVEQTFFRESMLPDNLISTGCLTEDECRFIREKPDRKDQMRILLAIIRGRDVRIMEHFVKYIEQDNAALSRKIKDAVDENMKAQLRDKRCVRCKLKLHVNIKYVADEMYAKEYISDKLYNEVIYNDRPAGAQDGLWDRLLQEVEFSGDAFDQLRKSLSDKHHYEHLAEEIDRFMTRDNALAQCACHVPLRPVSVRSSVSTSDSVEPASSDSRGSEISVELRSKLIERRGPRPMAMHITSEGLRMMKLKEDGIDESNCYM